jgi:hypothetical protein
MADQQHIGGLCECHLRYLTLVLFNHIQEEITDWKRDHFPAYGLGGSCIVFY